MGLNVVIATRVITFTYFLSIAVLVNNIISVTAFTSMTNTRFG